MSCMYMYMYMYTYTYSVRSHVEDCMWSACSRSAVPCLGMHCSGQHVQKVQSHVLECLAVVSVQSKCSAMSWNALQWSTR